MDATLLKKILDYNHETGLLFWRLRTPDMFRSGGVISVEQICDRWNRQFAGKQAFSSMDRDGYFKGFAGGKYLQAHRVAWAIFHGASPSGIIDHINGDRRDNRISNLRCVTYSENSKNRRQRANTVTGAHGVYLLRKAKKNPYFATIFVDGKSVYLGCFASVEEATEARIAAEQKHGFSIRRS